MWDKVKESIIQAEFLPFEFMLSLLTLFSGIWILSPWYTSNDSPANSAAIEVFGVITVIWLIVLGSMHLAACVFTRWPTRWKWRRFGTMSHFITYFFLGVVRALVGGPSKIIWLSIIVLALTSGLSYLSLSKWRA